VRADLSKGDAWGDGRTPLAVTVRLLPGCI